MFRRLVGGVGCRRGRRLNADWRELFKLERREVEHSVSVAAPVPSRHGLKGGERRHCRVRRSSAPSAPPEAPGSTAIVAAPACPATHGIGATAAKRPSRCRFARSPPSPASPSLSLSAAAAVGPHLGVRVGHFASSSEKSAAVSAGTARIAISSRSPGPSNNQAAVEIAHFSPKVSGASAVHCLAASVDSRPPAVESTAHAPHVSVHSATRRHNNSGRNIAAFPSPRLTRRPTRLDVEKTLSGRWCGWGSLFALWGWRRWEAAVVRYCKCLFCTRETKRKRQRVGTLQRRCGI